MPSLVSLVARCRGPSSVRAPSRRSTAMVLHDAWPAARSVSSVPSPLAQPIALSRRATITSGWAAAWAASTASRTSPAWVSHRSGDLGGILSARWLPLVIIGLIGALAFAVENAYQSWGAVFLRDQLSVVGGRTAAAPAVFAAVAAATRFAAGAFKRLPAGPLLTAGAAAATVGSMLLAYSSTLVTALIALALAADGTSILFPTLLREALSGVGPEARGRGTSAVATTAYLGFLLGPVYVGSLASATGLRNAIIGVAALAAVTAVIAWPVARWAGKTVTRPTEGSAQPDVDGAARTRARGPRRLPQIGPAPGESGAKVGL